MPSAESKSQRQSQIESRLLGLSEVVGAQVGWDPDLQDLFLRLRKLPASKLLAVLGRSTHGRSRRKATKRVIVELLDAILGVMLSRLAEDNAIHKLLTERLPRNRPIKLRVEILKVRETHPHPKYKMRDRLRILFQRDPHLFKDWLAEEEFPTDMKTLSPLAEKKLLPRYKESERLPRRKKQPKRGG